MNPEQSMLDWLEKVKNGDEQAAQVIWERFFPDLVRIARGRLPRCAGAIDDEEDVALSVLESFFKAARRGRFPHLGDTDGLWRLLSEMTRRKVVDRIRRHLAAKQGGGLLRGDSAILGVADAAPDLPDHRMLPADIEAILRERIHRLLGALRDKDPRLAELAIARMEGYSNEELAERFERSVPTIERWLQRIRLVGETITDE